ncbi:MAG: AAA family ATPase, partial [Clostridia bacterium]|nr:AAA family ATPase [Clostridia bacterium]
AFGITKNDISICYKKNDLFCFLHKKKVNELYGTNLDNGIDNGTFILGEDVLTTYLDNRKVFDFENDGPLFDYFEIALKDMGGVSFTENLSQILFENYARYGNHTYENVTDINLELEKYYKSKPLYIVLLYEFLSYLQDDEELATNMFKSSDISKLFKILKSNLREIDDYNKRLKRIILKKHPLSKHDDVITSMRSIKDGFCEINQYNFTNHVLGYFYFKPFRYYKGTICDKRYFSSLSDGQKQIIRLRYRLYKSLVQMDSEQGYRLTLDEPEETLHPEWTRGFWAMFIEQLKIVKELTKQYFNINDQARRAEILDSRNISLIVTTHSPFLLSDLAPQNIIALERTEQGKVVTREIKSTFAGNIAEMFYENFFMDSTIGKLAEQKIQKFIADVENKGITKERALRFVEIIGDDFLKKILFQKVERILK